MTRGRLFARLALVNGRTRLVEHHQNAPLKIARCFETDGGGLEVCVMDASPGLLAGDCNEFEWIVETGARVRVTTQGATRIHPSNGPVSAQNLRLRVAAGARLELWPQTTIPFRAARFETKISGHLEAGAQLLLLDLLSAGRIARGENLAFERLESRIQLFGAHGPLLCIQNRFVPAEFRLQNPLGWGDATQLGSLFSFGDADEK
ncbi:MAG TPA: urease accessory protein UreD, partial [Abditibacterium sp.]